MDLLCPAMSWVGALLEEGVENSEEMGGVEGMERENTGAWGVIHCHGINVVVDDGEGNGVSIIYDPDFIIYEDAFVNKLVGLIALILEEVGEGGKKLFGGGHWLRCFIRWSGSKEW